MNSVLGFVDLHDEPSLGKLTETRPLGSISFLGRYAIIDFVLSKPLKEKMSELYL